VSFVCFAGKIPDKLFNLTRVVLRVWSEPPAVAGDWILSVKTFAESSAVEIKPSRRRRWFWHGAIPTNKKPADICRRAFCLIRCQTNL